MTPKIYNATELARELGVDRGTVLRWAADGCPEAKREGKNRGSAWAYELLAVLAWLLERAKAEGSAGRGCGALSEITPTHAQVDLELAELRHAELRGEVLRVDDVLEIVGADYDSMRRALRSVLARVGPELWVRVTAGGSESDFVEALERV